MAQCGLHIPVADDSTVMIFDRVLADIGDEQSIAQSLSTFSSHMVNIVGILKEADDKTLILFDELGAGTDPVEGAALAAAIIEQSRELGALVAATTHYAELKVYAMTTPGVENASCEFDVNSLAPTYRLLIGIPGKSNAFAISERLGLPKEIIDKASARIDAENVRFEDVITRLEQQRQQMEQEKDQAGSCAGRWRTPPGWPGSTGTSWRRSGPRLWRRPRRRPGPFWTRRGIRLTACSRSSTRCAAASGRKRTGRR